MGIFASTDEQAAMGQALAVEKSYLPVRGDGGTPDGAPAMDDIEILTPDLDVINDTKVAAVARFNELFR
ncbi:hypothetical protein E3O42_03000 [Cryobacterium adonitolivorans]|uniref:Uncharacterized protein n=1 Tax=Cryobacterium adonitolivorans TaxID=1259189 RepID=A0A4R8WD76_9MICO|nr:hypothetical protein [Cryobacterium adonitolivorans]TFC05542.1 hypothetical protein E3O42_03000 [Cryobacterium adonitolivorans]